MKLKNILKRILSAYKIIVRFLTPMLKSIFYDLRDWYGVTLNWSRVYVLNLNAIDVCNSKCTMCNIWKNKEDERMTPDEFSRILRDGLFKHVRYVGITGGEPTLNPDLIQLYKVVIESLPRLRGLSIITNGIRDEYIFDRVFEIKELCARKGISFGVMVSIDGVNEIHDKVRGISGNFNSSMRLISRLRSHDIPVSFGCTISKENAWYVDDLLFLMKETGIYGRFRIAEYINRLYNNDRTDVIRNFSDDEQYHLATFFHKVELIFEKHLIYKRTYRNIRKMLLGKQRTIGCPYNTHGLVLNSRGEISYCAPKSKVIGNGLKNSPSDLYYGNIKERRRIRKENCKECIHDYHYEQKIQECLDDFFQKFQKYIFSTRSLWFSKLAVYVVAVKEALLGGFLPRNDKIKKVFIVGWYGTETVGDKAILGGIIEELKNKYPKMKLCVGSIYPYITERTLKELKIEGTVIDSKSLGALSVASAADIVIMGGGPLMDLEELMIPFLHFRIANLFRRSTIVYGCGIGPLFESKYKELVDSILSLSSQILLRDSGSSLYVKDRGLDIPPLEISGCPARNYIRSYKENFFMTAQGASSMDELACFLREWPYEYGKKYTKEEFFTVRNQFEKGLASYIKRTADEQECKKIRLYHMHNFVVGNDDRDFSRRFIKDHFSDSDYDISFDKSLSTVQSIGTALAGAKYSLCMRFHSVLFASTLGVPFEAIDYTLGGKIYNFLKDNNQLNFMKSFDYFLSKDKEASCVRQR